MLQKLLVNNFLTKVFCHFGPFLPFEPPNNPKNQNFEKKKKKNKKKKKKKKNAGKHYHFTLADHK